MKVVSEQVQRMAATIAPLIRFQVESGYEERKSDPSACDFCFGNPQEMPLPEIGKAIARHAEPAHKDWYAYTFSDPTAVAVVTDSLRRRHGIDFDAADVSLTNGAFGAIAATLRAVCDPGDEVLYLSPPWFFYEAMIMATGASPVRIDLAPPIFELPVDAIAAAISPATRAIIVNSPHNPSGRIYRDEELARLAAVLESASERFERPVYLLSDEAYSRILYDEAAFITPLKHYRRAILLYTYGKTLLTPGQRIGYIALPPDMPNREQLRDAIFAAQAVTGYAFPNAVMQYALADLEPLSIDVLALQRRRDRIVEALTEMGYECVRPEGTFYVLIRSPIPDEWVLVDRLARDGVFVLPGELFQLRGWFRISLTANDEMVERALPAFARAREDVLQAVG